jgi:hypothetical protein
MAIVIAWWFISAHKWFKGPVINVEHHMLGREEHVVNGVEGTSDSEAQSIPVKKAELEGESSQVAAELK